MTIPPPRRMCRARAPQALPAPAEPPHTLEGLLAAEQDAGAGLGELACDAETLALVMPMFDRVSATTTGKHALISERGGYGPVRLAGQGLAQTRKRIWLRLLSGRGERLVVSHADPARRKPGALHLFGADGHLRHRAELAAPEDLLILASLCDQLGAVPLEVAPPAPPITQIPVSIPQIRRAQAEWQAMGFAAHMDDLLLDGGQGRSACLRHLDRDIACPVPPDQIAPFVDRLAGVRLPFRRSVVRPGCIQAHSGPVDMVPTGGSLLVLRSKSSLFALDIDAVAACWLTQWEGATGRDAVIECYDRDGMCLALLAGRADAGAAKEAVLWNRLAGTLAQA